MCIMGCDGGDWSVAIGIDIVPIISSACRTATSTRHGAIPVAVELRFDSSTSSNDAAPSLPLHTTPLPFIDDSEASFALHIHQRLSTRRSHYCVRSCLQPGTQSLYLRRKSGARFSQPTQVRILLDVNGEPSRHSVANCPDWNMHTRLKIAPELHDFQTCAKIRRPYERCAERG